MSGIFISWLYMNFRAANKSHSMFVIVLLIFSLVMIAYGFWVRPFGGISKILATPSWTSICAGITTALFAFLYVLADMFNINKWAVLIRPAGTSTLTCYLVPYFYYAFLGMIGIYLPEFLRTGIIGIIKSLLFGLLIIFITGLLEKINIKLRI
jgi:predicted acyltransferase